MAHRGADDQAEPAGLGYLGDAPRSVRLSERRYAARQARRMLAEHRAMLDGRVRSGELTRQQRSRAMQYARREAQRTWGHGGGDAIGRWVRRFSVWVTMPVFGTVLLFTGSVEIGPAYAAAQGHGTVGYFVAQRVDTCDSLGRCSWTGTFTPDNSLRVRTDVGMDGTWAGVKPGTVIPALDSGDPSTVFPRAGSTQWERDAWFLVLGTAVMLPWLWFVVIRRLLRRQGPRRAARRALNW